MFDPGKVLKIKMEVAPGDFVHGRATIVDRVGSQLLIQVKTAREANKVLPKGTRIWFTNESPKVTFNGMWAASVTGTKLMQNKTMLLCSAPKHEQVVQKRAWQRVAIELPVRVTRAPVEGRNAQNFNGTTADISRSGLTVESSEEIYPSFSAGEEVSLVISGKTQDIAVCARVIRVERQWIAKKTVLGMEFVNLEPPGQDELDRLLVPLGGRPRNPELEEVAKQALGTGMASWQKNIKAEDKSNFALFEDNEETDDIRTLEDS